jgi:carbon monoxide dehydrogenase subunit G
VVEGYQADVLAGIQDIERKGEFEFDRSAVAAAPSVTTTPVGLTQIMNQNPNMTQVEAEEQYEQEMQGYYDQQYG